MGQKRKNHSSQFKAKVAMEAIKGVRTLSELATRYQVHPTQIAQWKKYLVHDAPQVFERGAKAGGVDEDKLTAPLFEQIGRLKVEVDFLRKKL